MNLPNKLTLGRIFLIPIIMIVYSITELRNIPVFAGSHLSVCNLILLILFFIGVLTDFIDGHYARKHNMVTDLGKFLDPLADKLLVVTLLIILLDQGAYYGFQYRYANPGNTELPKLLTWWMVVIVLAREFMVTGIRLIAAGKKKVIAASWYGKIKTTLQFATVLYLLAGCAVCRGNMVAYHPAYVIIARILLFAMLAITIYSGIDYLIKNIDVLGYKKKAKKEKAN